MKNIINLFNIVDKNLCTINGTMDYGRITDTIIALANAVDDYDGDDSENLWYIGEFETCSLDDLIVGAYWHYTEWHGGQWSKGYAALCALGQVFSPNMSMPEEDNLAYQLLNDLAAE
jgi:hypothetical protein